MSTKEEFLLLFILPARAWNKTIHHSVLTLDTVKRICQEWWPIGMDNESEAKESMLSAWLDDYYGICECLFKKHLLILWIVKNGKFHLSSQKGINVDNI